MVLEAGCPAGQLLYVGDRLDNDIRPAQAAGLATALIRRGPWVTSLTIPAAETLPVPDHLVDRAAWIEWAHNQAAR
jgi:FMN phosphatase YigB (HAD superfamily)